MLGLLIIGRVRVLVGGVTILFNLFLSAIVSALLLNYGLLVFF